MLPPATNPAGTAGNILLVEEYTALAMAFGAVLRRAEPAFETRVAASLAEAEAAVSERTPDLLIIDVDPAPLRAVAFFNRLKAAAPDLRVLVIAAEDAGQLPHEPNGPAVLRFIKKPFQVEAFAGVVRTLLDPGSHRGGGTLRDLRLIDLLVLHGVAGATTAIQVAAPDGRSGEIHFNDGRISHALVVGFTGTQALQEILRWRAPRVRELDRRSDAPRTIPGPWQSVLREALRATKTEEPAPPPREALTPAPEIPTLLRGKKVLVIDDTELLLVFVEEVLSTAEPTLQIVTASSGLAGVEKALAEKPDLILLDYSLPDITGGETCRRLLQDERTARVPIIMMSGHVPEMLSVADRYENVVAAIPKPFLSTALIELIDRTLKDLPKISARHRKKTKPASAPQPPKPPAEERGSNGTNSRKKQTDGSDKPAGDLPTEAPPPPPLEPPKPSGVEPTAPLLESPAAAAETPVIPATSEAQSRQHEPAAPAGSATPVEVTPVVSEPVTIPLPPSPPEPPIAASEKANPAAPPPPVPQPPPALPRGGLTRAVMQAGARNVVVLTLPLEVLSMQFSPSLQMRAIRARPVSPTISLHVLPQAAGGGVIADARFDLARVKLDARGQIDTIQLAPTTRAIPALLAQNAVSVVGLNVLLANGGAAMELMPAPAAPMRMQLTALFELAGVELSPRFRVAHLVLRWRGGNMHVTQQQGAASGGATAGVTFETAQILLDRSGRIAEILLDAPV